jgi:N utilization substance protein B
MSPGWQISNTAAVAKTDAVAETDAVAPESQPVVKDMVVVAEAPVVETAPMVDPRDIPSHDIDRGAKPLDTQRRLLKTKPEVQKRSRATASKKAAKAAVNAAPAPAEKTTRKAGTRRKGREMAMQMLFQADIGKQTPEQVRNSFWAAAEKVDPDTRGFAEDLFGVATLREEEIDQLIEAHSANWRLPRMAAVDRNLLRAATAEFLGFPGTPVPIVINESLEIARRYSTPESVNFLNGVLDAISRSRK